MITTATIPTPTHRCWQRLAMGLPPGFETRQLALQLLFKRLQHEQLSTDGRAREVYTFFNKYAKILGPEISQLETL
jgi:hypothetical protein